MGSTLQRLPIGIQGFEGLRNDGCLYVDKTRQVYDLTHTNRYYFLSCPRRFGKSLLLSTIKCYYEGKRELFEGLYIATAETEWKKHPVFSIDLNTEQYDTPEALVNKLNTILCQYENLWGLDASERSLSTRFEGIIRRAHEKTGLRTVILVDEYDKPMLQAIGNTELQDAYRNTLKGFYGALKSMDEHIQFAMLTGVTKFGKVSVFSDRREPSNQQINKSTNHPKLSDRREPSNKQISITNPLAPLVQDTVIISFMFVVWFRRG